ncbi:nitroreductase family protein [soil metagenome]
MELYDVMRTTSAVREFTGDEIPDEVLRRILDHARFAPSGGNRQGAHIVVVCEQATREALVELTKTGAKRYFAQILNGEAPWNPLQPCGVSHETVAATDVPDMFTEPLLSASVVLVVSVDLAVVAATDQDLDRIGVVSGASVYPLVWNLLLAARSEGYGGTLTTMVVPEETRVRALLGIPDTHAVAAVVPLGTPVKQPTRLTRQPVSDFVSHERFDGTPY